MLLAPEHMFMFIRSHRSKTFNEKQFPIGQVKIVTPLYFVSGHFFCFVPNTRQQHKSSIY